MIHSNADFEFNGLTEFHPQATEAGIAAILKGGAPIVADVGMICTGLSRPRLAHFGLHTHEFINDEDVIEAARREDTTRAVQAMRKAQRLGLLVELVRLIREEGVRPALVIGMPVGFVSAAESKDLLAEVSETPWIIIRGRKGGSSLVVGAIHALLALAEARQKAGQASPAKD